MGESASLETDYLVVGAGAMGMAFVDAFIDEPDELPDCSTPRRGLEDSSGAPALQLGQSGDGMDVVQRIAPRGSVLGPLGASVPLHGTDWNTYCGARGTPLGSRRRGPPGGFRTRGTDP